MSDDMRDKIAEALALQLNGPASDGRGWFRTEADRVDCYARADAVLTAFADHPVLEVRPYYPTEWAYEQACKALEKHRQRADRAEATIERVRLAWSEWRGRLGAAFPPAMVQEIDAALSTPLQSPDNA